MPRGARITDAAKLARIEGLVIPPAWQDVWISPNPAAELQATGIDAAGTTAVPLPPRLTARRRSRRSTTGLVRFGELLPGLRAVGRASTSGASRSAPEWTLAHAVTLINRAWFRVGSEQYARSVADLRGDDACASVTSTSAGRALRFTFRAKHRTLVRATLVDPELADGDQASCSRSPAARACSGSRTRAASATSRRRC